MILNGLDILTDFANYLEEKNYLSGKPKKYHKLEKDIHYIIMSYMFQNLTIKEIVISLSLISLKIKK
jgi:hypothetical protein